MKPCDCKDYMTMMDKLNESGVSYNDWKLHVQPLQVVIEAPSCSLRIPMIIFRRFAEWYLEDQVKEK